MVVGTSQLLDKLYFVLIKVFRYHFPLQSETCCLDRMNRPTNMRVIQMIENCIHYCVHTKLNSRFPVEYR